MKRHNYLRARDFLRQAASHQSDAENFHDIGIDEAARNELDRATEYKRLAWEASGRRKEALLASAQEVSLKVEPGLMPDLLESRIEAVLDAVEDIRWTRDNYGH